MPGRCCSEGPAAAAVTPPPPTWRSSSPGTLRKATAARLPRHLATTAPLLLLSGPWPGVAISEPPGFIGAVVFEFLHP